MKSHYYKKENLSVSYHEELNDRIYELLKELNEFSNKKFYLENEGNTL